ncbi:DUF397 domain-containing protein [Streptomyces jeddahensis]|uniref:DUF397 domain-containing protein n=1 Tax=Streptomyces jeddahensis TaxID=1716141 RepID=A0A177HI29_9ACTN|nr:DUF397 domain-containing protein [Streptomyces jeddahensis]OAH10249.1 hypothetical protein STSP_65050 [Streptomyces jeddahensis]
MSTSDELNWFKSSYSGSQGDSCVEVAHRPDAVYVRDSKEKEGPRFAVAPTAWVDFIRYVAF